MRGGALFSGGGKHWTIVLEVGVDPRGKRRQKWISFRGTKREAERELTRLLNEVQTGTYVEPAKLPLKEFLTSCARDCARLKVAPKTLERYEEIIQRHLIPVLSEHPLAKLQPMHIQKYYAEALVSGRIDRKGGLSAMTVLHHRLIRSALQQAVRWGLLARNPADAVENATARAEGDAGAGRGGDGPPAGHRRRHAPVPPVLLAVTAGLRLGEILGLRWQDLDLAAGTLAVRQALQKTKAGLSFKAPKTSKSRRVVQLPSLVIEALQAHRVRQDELRPLLGNTCREHGLVLPQDDGQPWSPTSLSKMFEHLVERAGVPEIRFHDLRHSHASRLLKHGVHAKVVSERLGHSRVGTTLDFYSHVLPGLYADAARKVDQALRAAMGESTPPPPAG